VFKFIKKAPSFTSDNRMKSKSITKVYKDILDQVQKTLLKLYTKVLNHKDIINKFNPDSDIYGLYNKHKTDLKKTINDKLNNILSDLYTIIELKKEPVKRSSSRTPDPTTLTETNLKNEATEQLKANRQDPTDGHTPSEDEIQTKIIELRLIRDSNFAKAHMLELTQSLLDTIDLKIDFNDEPEATMEQEEKGGPLSIEPPPSIELPGDGNYSSDDSDDDGDGDETETETEEMSEKREKRWREIDEEEKKETGATNTVRRRRKLKAVLPQPPEASSSSFKQLLTEYKKQGEIASRQRAAKDRKDPIRKPDVPGEDGHEPPKKKLSRSLSTPQQTNQKEELGPRSHSTGHDNMDTVEQPDSSTVMEESDSNETVGSFKSVDMENSDLDSDPDLGGGSKRGGLKIQIKRKNRTLKKKKN